MRVWVNFEMDNDKDTARGGRGNWKYCPVPNIPEEEWAEWLSEKNGWLVVAIVKV